MIKLDDFREAGINISDELAGNAALEWVQNKTTLEVDLEDPLTVKALPNLAKMFVMRFVEITTQSIGISSESIEGMSQSFRDNTDVATLLSLQADELLEQWLIDSGVRFVGATARWY